MKTLALLTLLIVGSVSLTACHWRHRHRYSGGYYTNDHGQNHTGGLERAESSRAA